MTATRSEKLKRKTLTISRAQEYYECNPIVGELYFKERPRNEFNHNTSYAHHKKRVGKKAGWMNNGGYVMVRMDDNQYLAHRVIWLLTYGELPPHPKFEIDHINGDRSDNKITNLRIVDHAGNQRNSGRAVNNTSGFRGVRWDKTRGKWRAEIKINQKGILLGRFETIEEAKEARENADKRYGFLRCSALSFPQTKVN